MNCGDHIRRQIRLHQLPALRADTKVSTEKCLCRRRSQTHDNLGLDDCDFSLEPWTAGIDLDRVRFLVDAPLAAWLPFEMFHCIRDVGLVSIKASFLQRPVENFSRRADEWLSLQIFLITGLL